MNPNGSEPYPEDEFASFVSREKILDHSAMTPMDVFEHPLYTLVHLHENPLDNHIVLGVDLDNILDVPPGTQGILGFSAESEARELAQQLSGNGNDSFIVQ